MIYTFEGTIKEIFDTITFDSGFSKREIVLTSNEQYPQEVKFEFIKEASSSLDVFSIGEAAKISFALKGNEYNGKYFVNLKGISIAKMSGTPTSSVPTPAPDLVMEPTGADTETDDLPF
jgi:single-strand DNA-binding protein